MKRGVLLGLGFCCSIVVAILLLYMALGVGTGGIQLPCFVEQTPLQVLELLSYEGPFLEDGSRRYVENVAALVVYNPSDSLLEQGAVKLQQGDRLLVFSFSWIPPGGRVMILESCAKSFSPDPVVSCWGWCLLGESNEEVLRVEEVGRTSLAVTNLTDGKLDRAVVWFKDYDPERCLFIGGISHPLEVNSLLPGHRIVVPVFRYVSGSSMVVR